jgi:hypothetical protein
MLYVVKRKEDFDFEADDDENQPSLRNHVASTFPFLLDIDALNGLPPFGSRSQQNRDEEDHEISFRRRGDTDNA